MYWGSQEERFFAAIEATYRYFRRDCDGREEARKAQAKKAAKQEMETKP